MLNLLLLANHQLPPLLSPSSLTLCLSPPFPSLCPKPLRPHPLTLGLHPPHPESLSSFILSLMPPTPCSISSPSCPSLCVPMSLCPYSFLCVSRPPRPHPHLLHSPILCLQPSASLSSLPCVYTHPLHIESLLCPPCHSPEYTVLWPEPIPSLSSLLTHVPPQALPPPQILVLWLLLTGTHLPSAGPQISEGLFSPPNSLYCNCLN